MEGRTETGREDNVNMELSWTQRPGHREEEEQDPQISRPEMALDIPGGHPMHPAP